MKEIYNKIIIKVKELRPTPEQKQTLIQECLGLINNRYDDMTKKKDGSRILQAIIKHGNEEVREKVVNELIPSFLGLVQDRYGHFLALKIVKYCPAKLRGKLQHAIKDKLNTLILHQFASEVIEQIYLTCPSTDKRDIVISFYGSHFLLLKQNIQISLKDLIAEKSKALEGIQEKIEGIATKLIDKGLIRHTIV